MLRVKVLFNYSVGKRRFIKKFNDLIASFRKLLCCTFYPWIFLNLHVLCNGYRFKFVYFLGIFGFLDFCLSLETNIFPFSYCQEEELLLF